MIVVDRKELCDMPVGTVYSVYPPTEDFDCLKIKTDEVIYDNSECGFSKEQYTITYTDEDDDTKLEDDIHTIYDFFYEPEQEFIVYDKQEVHHMIKCLMRAYCIAYANND